MLVALGLSIGDLKMSTRFSSEQRLAFYCLVGLLAGASGPPHVAAAEEDPYELMLIVSESFFDGSPDVEQTSHFDQVVLGLRTVGTAHIRGRLQADFQDAADHVRLSLMFNGTIVARTRSRRSPVTVDSATTIQFECRMPIEFSLDDGFIAGKVHARTETESTRHSVKSSVGGMRGRAARQIAWKRIRQGTADLKQRVANDARQQIETICHQRVEEHLALANRRLSLIRRLVLDPLAKVDASFEPVVRSTDHFLLCNLGSAAGGPLRHPHVESTHLPVELWLKFSAVNGMLTGRWPHAVKRIIPLLAAAGITRSTLEKAAGSLIVRAHCTEHWLVLRIGT